MEQMTELVVEVRVPIVSDAQNPIVDPERAGKILADLVARDLHRPPIEIAPVKEMDPLFSARLGVVALSTAHDAKNEE